MVGAKPFSRSTRAALGITLGTLVSIASAPAAQALPGPVFAPAAIASQGSDCSSPVPATAPISLAAPAPSKASEILGGQSALDAIRAQQAGPADHPLLASSRQQKFEPAAAPAPRVAQGCRVAPVRFDIGPQYPLEPVQLATPRKALALLAPAQSSRSDLVLGSRMVPIGRTSFDAQWQRVSGTPGDLSPTLASIGIPAGNRGELIASVNRWVNRRIAHAEDIDLFGRSDYWADAATTLRLGRGDCEDFALLKMELLAAAGIKREDMMLTLARDLIRRRDHAVLLVKTETGFVMLDNVGSMPLDASQSHGYRPVMSLGAKQSFLHGY